MNVHITCTPDFSERTLDNVVATLNSTKGVIDFKKAKVKNLVQYGLLLNNFSDKTSLNNNDLFTICEKYRINYDIPENDFFVIISDKLHSGDWFSAFRENNIYVIGSDWKKFTKKDYKYPIAFQVVENLFQTLCKLKIEEKIGDKWQGLTKDRIDSDIHMEKTTCVNGMCEYKSWISDKFIAGYICDSCYERAEQEIENPLVLDHIERLLKDLRDEFARRGNNPERVILPIRVDEKGEINVGSQKIVLNAQRTAFYIYFLHSNDGIRSDNIGEKENVLGIFGYYKKLDKISPDIGTIAGPLGWLPQIKINQLDNSKDFFDKKSSKGKFERVRHEIKKSIVKALGPEISQYYIIDNFKLEGLYKVKISHDKKEINLIPAIL